jgi:hypothetical protein
LVGQVERRPIEELKTGWSDRTSKNENIQINISYNQPISKIVFHDRGTNSLALERHTKFLLLIRGGKTGMANFDAVPC